MNAIPILGFDPAQAYPRYLDALLAGDRRRCQEEFAAWLAAGTELRTLYQDLIQRSLYEVGRRWERGQVSVATEHLATAISESKNRFLGMAAHDLRKPVGLIMTYAEFVLDEAGAQLSAQHRDFLRTCLAAATGMKGLIDNFLDVAVIESGKLRLDLAPASASEILAGAEPIMRLMAEKKKVLLLLEPATDGRRLSVDAPKLQQVLLNLVGNAVEHSAPGRRVWLSSRWENRQLVFAVRDEGPGLTPADQARLFTAFGRGAAKKTAGERSTGLGLAIARLVVEAHGGRIWVESQPGAGATFLFALPTIEGIADQPLNP